MLVSHALIIAVNFATDCLKHALSEKHYRIENDESRLAEMRKSLPYTLQETAVSGKYILLNRDYQLLGSDAKAIIPAAKYGDYTDAHIYLTSAQVDSVRSNSHGLFSDVDAPWVGKKQVKAYLIRLQALRRIIMDRV